jgi:hypothetical protein
MEVGMLGDGDDAGHCSNGSSADKYRAAGPVDRATPRAWLHGVAVFYVTILMLTGAIGVLSVRAVGLTQLADLYTRATTGPAHGDGVARPPAKASGSAWW